MITVPGSMIRRLAGLLLKTGLLKNIKDGALIVIVIIIL
jgi:predicted transcriptional regulator of viral defense system